MPTVTVHEAKTHLSRLLAQVEAGEEVVIARGKVQIAKIVPLNPPQMQRRIPGRLAHERPPGSRGILDNGFWDAWSDEEMGLGEDPLLDKKQ
jgi:antitoxin (DNA-binding transcriptional repressor) of toxin-antitoxin stability system